MLLTKLHKPRMGENIVSRTDLLEQLNKGISKKLLLVSASAGFGKSTLVSDWINKNKVDAAWFSIDSNDNDVADFFSYVIAAIQTVQTHFGKSALELIQSPSPPGAESIVNLLINDLVSIEQDIFLVLDDFHMISNADILKGVSYLLEYMPANLHVVLLTRSDPSLPIARLRSQNEVLEIRSADLSFQTKDIATLFNKKLKTKLTEQQLVSLQQKTEGWIAGLQLAALSLQGYDDSSKFIEAFAGNNRYIMDYLIEEVLKIQSDEVKDFLLKTSILEQFSAELCDAALETTGSQQMIEELEQNNMFVFPLDAERKWYRYHHLFADLLKQRLQALGKSTIHSLHNKASHWFDQEGLYELAIDHALQIENFELAMKLVGSVSKKMWEKGQHSAILKYGELLPDEIIVNNPEFCLYYSWILIGNGKMQKAEPFLKSAEKITLSEIENLADNSKEKKRLGKIAVAFAYYYSHREYSDKTFEYCQMAMDNLTDNDPLWFGAVWFSYGMAYFAKGDLNNSKDAFDKAFEAAKQSGNIYFISLVVTRMAEIDQQLGYYKAAYKKCSDLLQMIEQKGYAGITKTDWTYASLYFIMGITEFMWVELDKAVEHIEIAYELSKNSNDVFQKVLILLVSAYVAKERKEPDAFNRIQEIEDLMAKSHVPPYMEAMIVGWRSFLLIEDEQFEEAERVLKTYGLDPEGEILHHQESAYVSYCRLFMLRGDWKAAEQLMTRILEIAEKDQKLERLIEINVLFASLMNFQQKPEEGIQYLLKAMKLSYPENLLSYFVYNFGHTEALVQEIFKRGATTNLDIPEEFFNKLKKAIECSQKFWKKSIQIDLSARELDTLKLIAEGLINKEIAEKMFVSLNTVKTHVKNILLKLEVDNRTKAVTKAKELGIL